MAILFPALDPLSGWRELASLGDAALSARLCEMIIALRATDIAALAEWVHLPEDEVAASPFGLRAVAMGAAAGARQVHRELIRVPSWSTDQKLRPGHTDPRRYPQPLAGWCASHREVPSLPTRWRLQRV